MKKENKRNNNLPVVIFDLDDTLIKGQSQKYFIIYLYKKGYVSFLKLVIILGWFVLYKLHVLDNPQKAIEFALSSFKGAKKEEVEKEARFFYQEVLTKKIRPKIKKKLKQYQKKGHETLLVTNCVDLVAQEVGKNLGFDKVVSTRLENKGLKLTGKIEGEIVYGKNKTRALLKVISREKMKKILLH